jgi:hypothetical protein
VIARTGRLGRILADAADAASLDDDHAALDQLAGNPVEEMRRLQHDGRGVVRADRRRGRERDATSDLEQRRIFHRILDFGRARRHTLLRWRVAINCPAAEYQAINGNALLGIDLDDDGVTPNDPLDADTGANNVQNFPVIESVRRQGGRTVVRGSLESLPATRFQLTFYASSSCDPSGNGEGQRAIGTRTVWTDVDGVASFSPVFNVAISSGDVVTATATDAAGNTSEFSACVYRLTRPRTAHARALSSMEPSGSIGRRCFNRSRRRTRAGSSSDIAYAGAGPWAPRKGCQ